MRVTLEDLCLPQKPPGCQSPNTAGVSGARMLQVCAGMCACTSGGGRALSSQAGGTSYSASFF